MPTSRHLHVSICCTAATPACREGLAVWLETAGAAGLEATPTGADDVMAVLPLGSERRGRSLAEAVVGVWSPLLDRASQLGLTCVAVVHEALAEGAEVRRLSRAGEDGELLWPESVFRTVGVGGAERWAVGDHFSVELEDGLVSLVAVRRAAGGPSIPGFGARVVGRRRERQILEQALVQGHRHREAPTFLLLVGEAGMGKSTLVEETCANAVAAGFRLVRTHCVGHAQTRRETPVSLLIRSLVASGPASDVALRERVETACTVLGRKDALPLVLDMLDVPVSDSERLVLSRYASGQLETARAGLLVEWLQHEARECPLLLIVEDLHWAPDDLWELLEQLCAAEVQSRLTVVSTSRPAVDFLDSRPAISTSATTVELRPLSSQDARALAGELAAERRQPWQIQHESYLDDGEVERCILQAGGNPLHLTQLLVARETGSDGDAGPASLDALFDHRFHRLTQRERGVLEAAACIGFYFDAQRSIEVAEASSTELGVLLDGGLVIRAGEGYRFAHALIRDAVLGALPDARRSAIQRALALTESDPGMRAERWADAGDARAFPAFMEVAGQRRIAFQWFAALAALERASDVAVDARQQAEALIARGELHEEQGEGRRSLQCFETALLRLDAASMDDADALLTRCRLGLLAAHRLLGQFDKADALVRHLRRRFDAPSVRRDDPLSAARLDHLRGAIAFSRGQLELCRTAHSAALHTLESADPPQTRNRVYAQALSGMGDALYAQGAFHAARGAMAQCVGLAREQGLGRIEVSTLHMLGIVTAYGGDTDEAVALTQTCWEHACQVGDARAMLLSELNIALTRFWQDRAGDALDACDGGVARAEWMGSPLLMGMTRAFTGHIRMVGGDLEAARRDATLSLEHLRHAGERLFGGVAYGLALALACRGDEHGSGERADAWMAEGLLLLESSVVSHNYLYFTLGAVPVAHARADADLLWRLLAVLRDFFRVELERAPRGVVAALVAWVCLHLEALGESTGTARAVLEETVGAQPLLARLRSDGEVCP